MFCPYLFGSSWIHGSGANTSINAQRHETFEATHLDCIQVSGPGHRYVLGAHGPPYYVSSMVPPDSCFHRLSRLYGALCDEPFYYAYYY